ncbi:related to gibberellin cluster-GA14-synthase [Ramularia collo-cygni]|uniref:Related to gibberellin cluster-GA14-synthase n=1 Tax=Ramularia collo-cygni TaxID=112498 RepID=A0A2D3URJ7_9PEZI|nr:related to gibberellin cluster-GA14-synthase [Ramularia collo-cygni]CZT14087.1 related to gibberellin cluster-GA14-synthase [Ramularia collo-cygni]
MKTDISRILMLPPDYIDAVNEQAEANLSFREYARVEFLSGYDTFRTYRPPPLGMFDEAVMKGLTRSLPKFTKHLSLEMTQNLDNTWGESTEWREVDLHTDVLTWVARLSSRIFLGTEWTTNQEWIRVSINYTVDTFTAIAICKFIPAPIRWMFVQWLPLCRKVRRDYRTCERILTPVFKARDAEIQAAQREGRPPQLPDDSIEWFRSASKGRKYSQVDIQIALQVAAIHTTSDLLNQAILNLCANPEMMEPLREEALRVLGQYGWQKLALTELRLLDSFFKETQRLKPINMASMHRVALTDVVLSNGTHIRKGEKMGISTHDMWSPEIYENPEKFDGYRFLERRKLPGLEMKSQLVSTSTDHMGFSHGKHACPGRFFAANEVKIAMIHLILKYDMKISDPSLAQWGSYGVALYTNPKAKISIRARKPEIDLEELAKAL